MEGVFGKLEARSRTARLKSTLEALTAQRDHLRTAVQAQANLTTIAEKDGTRGGEEDADDDSERSQISRLMARRTQLEELLRAHHLIGGYDIIQTRQGKGVSVSLATAYGGVWLETYHLEMDLAATLRVTRHDVPPFIPLKSLSEQSNMQTDMQGFLDTLSQHLNAFAGRKQQLKLVKELHPSVEVMESNVLCTTLVLMFNVPAGYAVLGQLDYSDHTSCLPTRVHIQCEDKALPDSPQWEKNRTLLLETPVHTALATMKETGDIV